ncbi:hypothetical protein AAG570_012217 [Ranatra chinensis]|uniref:Uncharacterized protein n=1 Tax=Ranatra chinensis TaxID=642074 RepID=A0ABD0YI58_9HEMI
MSKARLLNEYSYTTWATSTMPLSDVNRNLHLDSTLGLVVKLANNDTDGLTHGDYYQGVQFLKTITDDKGQYPPNILALLEYIDYTTKEDGTDPVTPEETE